MNLKKLVEKKKINTGGHTLTFTRLNSCDSTNNYLRRNLTKMTDQFPVGISSRTQVSGRGRDNRKWFSARDQGLYISLGFFFNKPQHLNMLSLIAGITLSETLNRLTGREFNLKWPNDILYQGKKIAGILIENIIKKDRIISICGMGININHLRSDFPDDLRRSAISARMITGQYLEIQKVEPHLIRLFFKWLEILEREEKTTIINTAIRMNCYERGEKITFHQNRKPITARFMEINPEGGIVLEKTTGEKVVFFSGEIDPFPQSS